MLVATLPVFMDLVPKESAWASILGAVMALAVYVVTWSKKKVELDRTLRMAEAVRGMPENPVKPQP